MIRELMILLVLGALAANSWRQQEAGWAARQYSEMQYSETQYSERYITLIQNTQMQYAKSQSIQSQNKSQNVLIQDKLSQNILSQDTQLKSTQLQNASKNDAERLNIKDNGSPEETKDQERDIFMAYQKLLADDRNVHMVFPVGTEVNGAVLLDGDLFVDFSAELLNYGGNCYEDYIVSRILETGFAFSEVDSLTIGINGKSENLVEGTEIKGYTRNKWMERRISADEN